MSLTAWVAEDKIASAFASNEWAENWIRSGSTEEIDGWQWHHSWYEIVADIIDAIYGDHGDPGAVYAESPVYAIENTVFQGITLDYQLLADGYGNTTGLLVRFKSIKDVTFVTVECSSGDDIPYLDEDWSRTTSRTYATVLRGVVQMLEDEFKCLAEIFGY
ncbi:hypothetical protein [Nocardia sp. NPDC127526]|uniref:hypothetical protein n=1 Tax=Nocardia sp. NPDC127526 TaxID=3345393 RepID=UPI003636D288